VDAQCPGLTHVGHEQLGADGAWVLCPAAVAPAGCVVYSFGVRDDPAFEKAMTSPSYRCEVHSFDPTVSIDAAAFSMATGGANFHELGVGGKKETVQGVGKVDTIGAIMKDLGHRTVDVVKMDVEGSEWAAIAAAARDGSLRNIKQILLETHLWNDKCRAYSLAYQIQTDTDPAFRAKHFDDPSRYDCSGPGQGLSTEDLGRFREAFRALRESGFEAVYVHENPYGNYVAVAGGQGRVHCCHELAFVRKTHS